MPCQPRSSRAYTHSLPVFVLPVPGASTGTGVSSVWILSAANVLTDMLD